jgi:uncharacterized protein YndB with AHSA1/START domain
MIDETACDSVTIERTFPAPPETIWKLWTQPEHFAAWYGPGDNTIPVATIDLRVGGTRRLCMEVTTPRGPMIMWFTGVYLEIIENRRLVYTDSFSDEHGNVLTPQQAGMPPGHPATTEVRVDLHPANTGTRMILTHIGIPPGSPGAIGWTMALDKLHALADATSTP